LAVLVVLVAALAWDRFSPSVVMLFGLAAVYVGGVIDEQQAFSGFSNAAPITVAALYVLAGASERTGALQSLTERAFGRGTRHERRQLARMLFPTAAASGFIANTPLVGMLAPRADAWARRVGHSPSRYLMPISYAAVFGGVITVIGTSTNLTVSGLLTEDGQKPLGLFEITLVGLPIAIVGVTLVVLLAPRLLPPRVAPSEDLAASSREFIVEMEVFPGSPLAGRTVADAGLRNLQGVYLVEIERDGRAIAPVAPEEALAGGDRLVFAGNAGRVVDLQAMTGLRPAAEQHFAAAGDAMGRRFYEAVLGDGSPLEGTTLKDIDFRSRYGAAVFAIHRAGERLLGKLGEVRLRGGDVMLLVAEQGFDRRWRDANDFLVVSPLGGAVPLRREKARIVELATLTLVLVAGLGLLDVTKTALVVALALVALRVIRPDEARRSIDMNIIVLIAASFGIGAAVSQSGLALEIADLFLRVFERFGDVGILAGILIATMIATELLSNNAAAVLMFPIAMATAERADLEPRSLAIAILTGASLSFLTPVGYQTNTMVFSMGGYKFRDFTRLGFPLTIASAIMAILLIPLVFGLHR
jgi:di/tricarboxylate transporter